MKISITVYELLLYGYNGSLNKVNTLWNATPTIIAVNNLEITYDNYSG